ncbi:MAG: endopeptidase La [Candidatus Babeliales bacterium]
MAIEQKELEKDLTGMEEPTPETIYEHWISLLPLKNVVVLPKSIHPVIVGRESSIKAVEAALKNNSTLFVTAQKSPDTEKPFLNDIYEYGTESAILQVMRMPNGALKILIEGIGRAKITHIKDTGEYQLVQKEDIPTTGLEQSIEIEAISRQIRALYGQYVKLNEKIPADLFALIRTIDDLDSAIDTIAVHINLSFDERQHILEMPDLKARMLKLASLLEREIEILETEQRIKGSIQSQVEKNQREYYLTEQIKAIQKELGREDQSVELDEIRIKADSLKMSQEARERVDKELKRLEQMPPMSSEAVVSRNYLDWLTTIPWGTESKDRVSMTQAEKILNKHHAGLKKVKERILEFIGAKKFSGAQERSSIICLVGPPGVGKTSLAQSIANSLGREFVRISLGGVRDEAEIRGHRKTYIGSMPGKIVQSMKKAKTINPVVLLDEIDKLSRDWQGDPSAALLEVLDPEQNKTFMDHFLDIEYDLSKVMFICTANMYDGIPYPLLDRMELIHLAGYTQEEKLHIARTFLLPKKLNEFGLKKEQIKINDEMLCKIISEHTKEAGVRQLERIIAKLMRKTIQMILKKEAQAVTITDALIKEWLGYAKFKNLPLDTLKNREGIATGLAWTELGGDVLEIETSIVPGKGTITLTGQLGEVMQESAQAALSYVRSRSKELGIKPALFDKRDIHIHVPEGATPKDGPSAGITMGAALVSALTGSPVQANVAMTGEITLRGRVLPVGGLKEKILAAQRFGMKKIIVPKENFDEIQEFIHDLNKDLKIIYAEHMDEVLNETLHKKPFSIKKTTSKRKKALQA